MDLYTYTLLYVTLYSIKILHRNKLISYKNRYIYAEGSTETVVLVCYLVDVVWSSEGHIMAKIKLSNSLG